MKIKGCHLRGIYTTDWSLAASPVGLPSPGRCCISSTSEFSLAYLPAYSQTHYTKYLYKQQYRKELDTGEWKCGIQVVYRPGRDGDPCIYSRCRCVRQRHTTSRDNMDIRLFTDNEKSKMRLWRFDDFRTKLAYRPENIWLAKSRRHSPLNE